MPISFSKAHAELPSTHTPDRGQHLGIRISSAAGRKPWAIAASIALSAICFAALSIHLSHQRILWSDEFDAWNLITDSTWGHMIQSWNQGADSGGILFYLLTRSLLLVTGPHPLTIRLFSAFCLWLAAVLWWRILRRSFSNLSALVAVASVWLCNYDFVYHLAEVRFYGMLVLTLTLVITAVLWIEEHQPSIRVILPLSLVTGQQPASCNDTSARRCL